MLAVLSWCLGGRCSRPHTRPGPKIASPQPLGKANSDAPPCSSTVETSIRRHGDNSRPTTPTPDLSSDPSKPTFLRSATDKNYKSTRSRSPAKKASSSRVWAVLHHPGVNPNPFAQDASIGDAEGISLGLDDFLGQTEMGSYPVFHDPRYAKGHSRFQGRHFDIGVLCRFVPRQTGASRTFR